MLHLDSAPRTKSSLDRTGILTDFEALCLMPRAGFREGRRNAKSTALGGLTPNGKHFACQSEINAPS